MKKGLLKIVAKTAERTAEFSGATTSVLFLHQPKTPEMLKKLETGKSKEVL